MPAASESQRSLRRNALASLAGRIVSVTVWIAVTPFVLGRLGAERFGVWSLFFMLGGYATALDLGMAGGIARFLPVAVARQDRHQATQIIHRSLGVGVLLGILWMALCFAGRNVFLRAFHVPDHLAIEVRDSLSVFAFSLFALSLFAVLQGALWGFRRFDLSSLYAVSGLVVHATVLVGGLSLGYGLLAAALAALVSNLVVTGMAWRSVRRSLGALEASGPVGPGTTWRELLGFGAAVQLSGGFGVGQMQVGRMLLGMLGRLTWVTSFELGFRVANALWSLPTLIHISVTPNVTHALEIGGRPEVLRVYEWCCRWVYATAGWALGLLWVVAPPLFLLWLGDPSLESVTVARWLAIAFAVGSMGGPAGAVARGHGWPGLEILFLAVALAVNLALGVWLIPWRGAEGAAIAMIASFAAGAACILAVLHRRLEIASARWLGRLAAPRLLPAAVAAAAVWLPLSRWRLESRADALPALVVGGISFTGLYALLTWRTGDPRAVWTLGRGLLGRLAGKSAPAGGAS